MIIPRNASTSPRCPGTAASGAAELRAKVLTADCRDTVIPYRGEAWGLLVVTSGNRAGSQPSLLPGLGTHETLPAAKVKGLPWAPLAPPCLGVPLATGFRAAPGVGPYGVGHEWGEGWGDPWGKTGWAWGGADGVGRRWLWQGGCPCVGADVVCRFGTTRRVWGLPKVVAALRWAEGLGFSLPGFEYESARRCIGRSYLAASQMPYYSCIHLK